MRKEVIFTVAILLILPLVIFSMTQNTRFEENIIKCISPKNIFKITYAKLGDNVPISFEKNDNELQKITIDKFENEIFYFRDEYSDYKLDLIKLLATETLKSETQIYKCELTKFKM